MGGAEDEDGVSPYNYPHFDDYVAAAVRLARDVPWRQSIKDKIARNKHRLYRDAECISALETFLETVVGRSA